MLQKEQSFSEFFKFSFQFVQNQKRNNQEMQNSSIVLPLLNELKLDIDTDICNAYIVGSRMFQVDRHSKSDDDYLIVLTEEGCKKLESQLSCSSSQLVDTPLTKSSQVVFDNKTEVYVNVPSWDYRSDQVDATLLSQEGFERCLAMFDSTVIECASLHYYSSDSAESGMILVRNCEYRVPLLLKNDGEFVGNDDERNLGIIENMGHLRANYSKKSGNSYVKCKKKITVEKTVQDQYIGYKSLFHSLRLSTFGVQIASHGYVADFKAANGFYNELVLPFVKQMETEEAKDLTDEEGAKIWSEIDKRYKSIRNKLASELRKAAPLPQKNTPK